MEKPRESWNDERLDELSRRMDAGFEKAATREETNLRFDTVDQRFDEVNRRLDEVTSGVRYLGERFDRLQNTLMIGLIGLIAAIAGNAIFG